ncbi:hypothetical protein B0E46_15745 [Rhodanobacter sp. B04]|nr:hypothetical protein B0E46_15745 [Rhodanobacter sp. B04]
MRFSSVAAMPDSIRNKVEAQGKGAPAVPRIRQPRAPTQAPGQPRQDPEHQEQVNFFRRIGELAVLDARYAIAARRTFAIPNGGGRSKREAGRLKAEGVTAGVSDIFCSIARAGRHGLYIEMKSLTGYASREQSEWIAESIQLGYEAATCRGADVAFALWKGYVDAT